MRYIVLATDYDGTIAHHGKVDAATVAALEQMRLFHRKLVMVTGRELPDLQATFDRLDLFEWIVAENGALLYHPATRAEKVLAEPPPAGFVAALKNRGVQPISVGKSIVATWHPHENAVLETIREMGLGHQVIFNKDAVMILPPAVNKATGLKAVLQEMKMSLHNVVGVGDAENDQAFLGICEASAAVLNALPRLADLVDLKLARDHGAGVQDLIARVLENDLADIEGALIRHYLLLGVTSAGEQIVLPPYGLNILTTGAPEAGPSRIVGTILERLVEKKYQFCAVDPEGAHGPIEGALTLGHGEGAPKVEEILQALDHPGANVIVQLKAVPAAERPAFFQKLLFQLVEMRARLGRPHWIAIERADEVLPEKVVPGEMERMLFATAAPERLPPLVLQAIDVAIVEAADGRGKLDAYARSAGLASPPVFADEGPATLWWRKRWPQPMAFQPALPVHVSHEPRTK